MEEQKPKWTESALPFMVVVRESSSYTIPAQTGSQTLEEEEVTMQSNSESSTMAESSTGEFNTRLIYPEVKYVFADDDFNPTVDVLERNKDEVSLIVDLDEDQNVTNYCSLSPSWQVSRVETSKAGSSADTPAWLGQDESVKLFIDGTTSTVTTMLKKHMPGTLRDTRDLVRAVQDRSDQLNKLLYGDSGDEKM